MTSTDDTTFDVFERTMRGLEQTLLVEHVATFGPITCSPDEEAGPFLERYREYDQFPVCHDDRVIGVLERERCDDATTVGACMRPLDESILIAAGEPLETFLPLMATAPYYRLVLRGRKIDGVVTRSDVLKLPVRLLAFARVTHLELLLASLVERAYDGHDDWLKHLSSRSRKLVLRKKDSLMKDRADPPLLELARLEDKGTLATQRYDLEDSFEKELKEVVELRHKLAHAGDYAHDMETLELFFKRLALADKWIEHLSRLESGKPE